MSASGAEAINWARRMHGRGVVGGLHIDWHKLIAFKHFTVRGSARKASPGRALMCCTARHYFTGPDRIRVEDQTLVRRHILIATGVRSGCRENHDPRIRHHLPPVQDRKV